MASDDIRPTDSQGRPSVQSMTDREIAEETLATLRAAGDAFQSFTEATQKNPMLRTMFGNLLG